jgi:hypothetical protein
MTTATFEESVRKRAFELFLERGAVHGNDQEDWFRAETELRAKNSGLKPKTKPEEKSGGKRRM